MLYHGRHTKPGMGTVDVVGGVGHCEGARKGVGKVIEASEGTIFFFFILSFLLEEG